MVQFKKVFLGLDKRPFTRATTAQKCLRVGGKHNDLENVGRTARHHTFFEMLGNFSFGDYFKREAIDLAWTFVTQELGLDPNRLYITVYRDDDEAARLWQQVAGVPAERIYRLGEKDNFWAMGDTGPCGPCSEIHVDQGEDMACGPLCGIGRCDCDRFLEIWNLVFMQYERAADGTLSHLPRPSIDTGMGLERITAVCQGKRSNFDTDLFQGIIQSVATRAGVAYGAAEDSDTALRVIADHSRAIAFLVADGMLPSNEGRGYVLRRLIRRAFRFGRLLGLTEPFLHATSAQVVQEMGAVYPELDAARDFLVRVVRQEEERFGQTLDRGLSLLEDALAALPQGGTLDGEVVFRLYDTYGFPLDIINDIAQKGGYRVDETGFMARMAQQKQQSRKAWAGSGDKGLAQQFAALTAAGLESEFVGYEALHARSRISALLDAQGEPVSRLEAGTVGYVAAVRTPFYGEAGGQVGDRGRAETATGCARVLDALRPAPHLTVHKIEVSQGEIQADQEIVLTVEEGVRLATARNHTCTHLLHAALRRVLGEHVTQAGSLVSAERLRFDFKHFGPLTEDELARVEDEVNRVILADQPVCTAEMDHEEAVARGAMALFGEKYGARVRVVEVPGESLELCGGTHLERTGQAGCFAILSESGVAAGVRRIEAVSGWGALRHFQALRAEVRQVAQMLRALPGEVANKVQVLRDELKALEKEAAQLRTAAAQGSCDLSPEQVGDVAVVARQVGAADMDSLRRLVDDVRSRMPSGIVALAADFGGKAGLVVAVSKDLHSRWTAPALVKVMAPALGGGGGGRPDLAQAGGSNPQGIPAALDTLRHALMGGSQ